MSARPTSCPTLIHLLIGWLVLGQFVSAGADDGLVTDGSPATWQDDAELTDVFFINATNGWVVGAQGTILRTVDGGRSWSRLGQVESTNIALEMRLQDKIRAMQSGAKTAHTGVADGSNDPARYRCRFESVFFIDDKHGWVAGGYEVPCFKQSRGILMRTADGGKTWRQVSTPMLPRVKRIRFSDRLHGWAVGDRGNLLPSSFFFTADGGETWTEQTLQRERTQPNYRDADATETGFVAVDDLGLPITIKHHRQEPAVLESSTVPNLNRVRMLDRRVGWAVGNFGAVWRTQNGGASWSPLTDDPTTALFQQLSSFDWYSIGISPSKIWLAGNPGTTVLSIDRQSGEILRCSTGNNQPINAIFFVDDLHGWMVGALGIILATEDGGKTWHRKNGRHQSIAALGLSFEVEELPLEALAQYSNEDEWLMAVAICTGNVSSAARQAVERLGAVGIYSLNPSHTTDSPAIQEQQIERLVKLIRTLRPKVILCNSEYTKQISSTGTTIEGLVFDPYLIVSTAVKEAASQAYPHQIELAGLAPWQVERVAYRTPAGDLTLDPRRMLLRSGCLCEDRISLSRALLQLPMITTEKKSYRLESLTGNRHQLKDLFTGLAGSHSDQAPQRPKGHRLVVSRTSLEVANRKYDKLVELSRFEANTEQDLIIWNQKVTDWLAPIDESLAGLWLAQLAEDYLASGKNELAAKSLEYLVDRYVEHPLRLASLVWLAQYFASDEFGLVELDHWKRFQAIQFRGATTDRGNHIGQPVSRMYHSHQNGQTIRVWAPVNEKIELPRSSSSSKLMDKILPNETTASVLGDSNSEVQVASHSETRDDFDASAQSELQAYLQSRWRRAGSYLNQLYHADQDFSHQPWLQFFEANLKRKLTGPATAEAVLKNLTQARNRGSFSLEPHGIFAAAKTELDLITHPNQIESSLAAVRVSATPYLDGQLNDDIWQTVFANGREVKRIPLNAKPTTNRRRGWSDEVPVPKFDVLLFAHDDQHLYVAIKCQKLPGQFYQMSPDPRPRDPDLSRRDRVELAFDIDRDYRTAFTFTVDYRGWGAEELNGAKGWNPQWFIARSEDEASWTVELAIPLTAIRPTTVSEPPRGLDSSAAENGRSDALQNTSTANPNGSTPPANQRWAIKVARKISAGDLWSSVPVQLEKTEFSHGMFQKLQQPCTHFLPFILQ